MEEISKYSNTCINFVDFYVQSKSKLDAMLKLLKEVNQTFEPKNQSCGEWIKSLIKASVTPAFNATVYFFTSQLLKYLFSA